MKRNGLKLILAMAVLSLVGMSAPLHAEDGLTVQGSGQAKARPTQVEIAATLTGEGELATDATVKFRDAKKRALAAITNMKNADLSVTSQGVSISNSLDANTQMMMMRGQAVQQGNTKIQVRESDKIVLTNADKLEPDVLLDTILKILDTAKDAGFTVGTPPPSNYYEMQTMQGQNNTMVAFVLPDPEAIRQQAYKMAVDDAKAKAQKIADLSGIKLGRILSIAEGEKIDSSAAAVYRVMNGGSMRSSALPSGISGDTSGDLTLHVNLTVLFEIAK